MNNRLAFITGASSGIGKATALKLGKAGYKLIICGRREDKLLELQNELGTDIVKKILVFDVSDAEAVKAAVNSLSSELKNIDILVNNAGNAHGLSSFQDGELSDWDAMIGSNINGLLYVSKTIVPFMVENKTGHIINISSVAGKHTYENGAVYCATKKSVEAISEGMRLDLTKHGIKVTNVAPGAVETEFSVVRFKGDAERAAKVYEGFDPILPEDVADAIFYAISAPDRLTVADITLYAKAQSAPTTIYRK